MFWIETKPTSNDTGKSQNNVNPLIAECQYGGPNTENIIVDQTPRLTTQSFTN